ncbi:MAG: DUF262 domain-containing protein [Methanobacterium paludis]|nr:DUF262 domain-containing protein [Methanobacterium paludis]
MVDEDELLAEIKRTKNSLSTDRLDMSFGEIMSMYENEELIINPEFQRLFRWKEFQKTRFIESILLGIPIPPIFVAEDEEGKWELVDGLQRISTIFSFFGILKDIKDKNDWKLEKGVLVDKVEGLKCADLPLKLRLNIKRSVCRVEIIRWNSEYDMRYELFNRLNTGGSELTAQEIRNCIFRGISNEFNKFLSKEAQNSGFIKLISPTEKQFNELYLDELVLRFCSLYENAESVNTSMSQHMTDFMREIVKKPEEIRKYDIIWHRTLNLLIPLGKEIFRAKNGGFSPSFYDGIMIGVSQNIDKYEQKDSLYLKKRIQDLKTDKEFKKATGSYSFSKARVIKRLNIAHQIFERD